MTKNEDKEPELIDLLEKDPYFAEYIPTPAWDGFKNALIKAYNLDKKNGSR
jgi:hypothetical protein